MARDGGGLMTELLSGDLVRALRLRALSDLVSGLAVTKTDPISADALILSAMQLKARAEEIEWLAARYVQLGQEVEYWTRVAESPRAFVETIIGQVNP